MHPADAFQRYRKDILEIAESFGARNLRVFGSVARGEATEGSDLDLLVDLEKERGLFDLIGLKQELEDLLDCRVEVMTEASVSRHVREAVVREAVAL